MRVLITGGTGYLGKYVVNKLSKDSNNEIVLLVKEKDYCVQEKNIKVYSIEDDLDTVFSESVDCILHLATSYGRKNETNEYVLNTNLMFPLSIIEKAIENNVKCFLTWIHQFIN